MLKQENLAANFCGLLSAKGIKYTSEWRILGQEKDGSLLAGWISRSSDTSEVLQSNIGIYLPKEKNFEVLHSFDKRENIIQASVNSSKTLLLYVIKDEISTDNVEVDSESAVKYVYKPFLTVINNAECQTIHLLELERNKQILLQFLWRKQSTFEKTYQDKFLVMIHTENIYLFTASLKKKPSECEMSSSKIDFSRNDDWYFDKDRLSHEVIVRSFTWCEWDPAIQSLYYIHLKQTTRICLEKEEDEKQISPTLSAFQFNDDLPTETVLNIPLNLPKIPSSSNQKNEIYEDDTIPLRVHDSSLNLEIVSNECGMLFVCHYYLYQANKQSEEGESSKCVNEVHFAYSITILHHGCVIHCIVPGIPWEKAKLMKPSFILYGGHMLVFQADLFMHLLDIGLSHEPCCHIVCQPFTKQPITHLVPCFKQNSICYDSLTLNLISITIPKTHLIETFRNDESIHNRLSIIHYFLAHYNDIDIIAELLNIIMEQPLNLDTVPLMKEILIAGTYSSLKKGLSQDALSLIKFLPLTTSNTSKPIQAKISNLNVGLSHETLYNTTMMLLSPQQRLSPYRQDIWTRLYERLNENNKDGKQRFTTDQVSEKLMYSLACYQPEALSRCSTPLSPTSTTTQLMMGQNLNDLTSITSSSSQRRNQNDMLPFIEFETCTASKQEHVISVNLRELSMHLVKHSVKQITGFRWLKDSYFDPTPAPSFVHAVSTRYVTAQLEISRLLCVFVCRAAGVDARIESERGFALIDQLSNQQQFLLFLMLERYNNAVESMAFPLPQGFSSFFTYLGYRALTFDEFLQYAQRHVFELQIDVMKTILGDIEDTNDGVKRKLALLSLLPRSRARRLLNNWNHPVSCMIRGRDHATNILSGNPVHRRSSGSSSSVMKKSSHPIGNNPDSHKSIENLAALNSFLNLLTAKASLNELDFNLLIETTMSSFDDLESG